LAAAGGVTQPLTRVSLQLSRTGKTATMPLDSIIRDPKQKEASAFICQRDTILEQGFSIKLMPCLLEFKTFMLSWRCNDAVYFLRRKHCILASLIVKILQLILIRKMEICMHASFFGASTSSNQKKIVDHIFTIASSSGIFNKANL